MNIIWGGKAVPCGREQQQEAGSSVRREELVVERLCRAQEGLSLRSDRYGGSRPFKVFLLKLSALTFGRRAKGPVAPKTLQ